MWHISMMTPTSRMKHGSGVQVLSTSFNHCESISSVLCYLGFLTLEVVTSHWCYLLIVQTLKCKLWRHWPKGWGMHVLLHGSKKFFLLIPICRPSQLYECIILQVITVNDCSLPHGCYGVGVHPLSAQESIGNSFSNCLFVLAKGWNLGFIHVAIYHCSKTGNIGNIHVLSNCGLYSCVVNLEHTEGI